MKFEKITLTYSFLAMFFTFSSLTAQTTVWEGTIDNVWENEANWGSGLPIIGGVAVIPSTPSGGIFPEISVNTDIKYQVQNFGVITLNASVDNNGTFTNYGNARIVNRGIFINFQNVTYQNAGDLTNKGTFDNRGSLSNFGSAVLTNSIGGNLLNRSGSSITNFGIITNAGTLVNEGNIVNTAVMNNDGIIQNDNFIQNGITAHFNNNINGKVLNNGTFEIGGNVNNAGTFINNNSVIVNSTGTLTNDGEFQNLLNFSNDSGIVDNNGDFLNKGLFNNNFGGIFNNNGNINNTGTLEVFECSFLYQYSQTNPIDGQVWNFGVIYILGAPVNFTPMQGSFELFSIDESPSPTATCRNIQITLDDNGTASIEPAQIDGGSSALYCTINGIFVDRMNFNCADVGLNTVTLTIEDFFGNSSSCQANVEVITSAICDPSGEFCTFTQGYYGNPTGIQFGQTTIEIIEEALSDGNGNNSPIILGSGNRTLQVDLEAAQCVINLLPGGGSPKLLPQENNVLGSSCNTGSISIKNGRFNNILLAQTLTLALNLRYDQNLSNLLLGNTCINIPISIYNDLGEMATVGDLLDHANNVLGGGSTLELSDIPEALGNINDYFDECAEACITPSAAELAVINLGLYQSASSTELVWITNSEGNNSGFIIEHSSDGTNFDAIAEIESKDGDRCVEYYEATDTEPVKGENIYRIKEIYKDGTFKYSNIEVMNFAGDLNVIRVHPNPTTERIFVDLKPYKGLSGTIQIWDARGNQRFNQNYDEFSGGSERIELNNYLEGIYIMTIQADGNRTVSKRFMVGNL